MSSAVIASIGCVGGLLIALVMGIVLMLFSVSELKTLLYRWLNEK